MIKLQKYIVIIIFIFGYLLGYTQQFTNGSQYLFNPYALTPTLAGYTGYSEVFLDYRNNWNAIESSPKTFNANGFGNIYKEKMWIGGKIMSDNTDILSVFTAELSYTYKLKVETNQYLFFGIWTSIYQASINTGLAVGIDPNDPLIQNSNKINSTTFNAGFGINYNWKDFNIGFSIPSLFAPSDEYTTNTSFNYQVDRKFQLYSSYLHEFNHSWQMQVYGIFQETANEPINIETSLMVIYLKQFWTGILYRNSKVIVLNIGGHIYNGFVFNYSYEIGIGSIDKGLGGLHEMTIGYRFGFNGNNYFIKKRNNNSSVQNKKKKSRNSSQPKIQDYIIR